MQIRKAQDADLDAIVALNDAVQRMHAENYPDIFKYPPDAAAVKAFFAPLVASVSNYLFVAEVEGVIAGYVWAAIEDRRENAFKYRRHSVYIHQIGVRADYRKQGIGSGLIDQVQALAQSLGITTVALDSWAFNTDAHAFFRKLGFEQFNFNFWRR